MLRQLHLGKLQEAMTPLVSHSPPGFNIRKWVADYAEKNGVTL